MNQRCRMPRYPGCCHCGCHHTHPRWLAAYRVQSAARRRLRARDFRALLRRDCRVVWLGARRAHAAECGICSVYHSQPGAEGGATPHVVQRTLQGLPYISHSTDTVCVVEVKLPQTQVHKIFAQAAQLLWCTKTHTVQTLSRHGSVADYIHSWPAVHQVSNCDTSVQ